MGFGSRWALSQWAKVARARSPGLAVGGTAGAEDERGPLTMPGRRRALVDFRVAVLMLKSRVQELDVQGVVFDELAAGGDFVAHEEGE